MTDQLRPITEAWEDAMSVVTTAWKNIRVAVHEPIQRTRLAVFGPRNWIVFQGEHSGLWWSIPDDDRCDGALHDTFDEAVEYAINHTEKRDPA